MTRAKGEKPVAENRKAGHDFHILDTFEAGVALIGTEVKAIREGSVNLRDSYCQLERAEAYLLNVHIGQYSHGGYAVHDPLRPRKLLLHRDGAQQAARQDHGEGPDDRARSACISRTAA